MLADRLSILRCPETGSTLTVAEPALIARLNVLVAEGRLKNRAGQLVESRLDGGLLRDDGRMLYPVVDEIPVLLKDEAIPLEP
jgi:uncharacterized protein YbaR (Trm112 family)